MRRRPGTRRKRRCQRRVMQFKDMCVCVCVLDVFQGTFLVTSLHFLHGAKYLSGKT